MGFDISFHPVDPAFIHERVLSFISGQGKIDDLVEQAVRIAEVRFRANAWGLGVLQLQHAQAERERARKKGGTAPRAPAVPATFESHLHVWGRPFFITMDEPTEVSAAIDRYLAASPADVDDIAREMIQRLDPALVSHVKPDRSGRLAPPKRRAQGIRYKMDFLRECFRALRRGETVTDGEGEEADPRDFFIGSFPLDVVEFAAHFRPGWMARGYVWPTHLLGEAGVGIAEYFQTAAPLFEPLAGDIPEIAANLEDTITANYMLGGYVPPDKVPALRALVEGRLSGWNEDTRLELRKTLEALHDAERRGLGFVEAAEIYSGPAGIMN